MQGIGVVHIGMPGNEAIAIVPLQPIFGGKPDIALPVLPNLADFIARQPALCSEVTKYIRLFLCRCGVTNGT
jgi:hypothetical protein